MAEQGKLNIQAEIETLKSISLNQSGIPNVTGKERDHLVLHNFIQLN